MDILKDLRDGKPCRWTGVCGEMSAVGGCTCGEAADEIERLREELAVVKESLPTCKRSLQLADSLTEFMEWTEALAIVGSVTPEAWDLLNKITRKAEKVLTEGE